VRLLASAAEAAAVGVSPNSAIEKAKHKKEEQDTAEKTANTRTQKETKNAKNSACSTHQPNSTSAG